MISFRSGTKAEETFTLGGQVYNAVTWWNDSGLRSLYFLLAIPLVTSMTNGYDGEYSLYFDYVVGSNTPS
jgi:hypothetical protein